MKTPFKKMPEKLSAAWGRLLTLIKGKPVLWITLVISVITVCVLAVNLKQDLFDDSAGNGAAAPQAMEPQTQDTNQNQTQEANQDTVTPDETVQTPPETANSETKQKTAEPEEVFLAYERAEYESAAIASVTAQKQSGNMISRDTAFTITTSEDMEAGELKPLLALSPGANFDLTKDEPNTFTLKSNNNLPENSIVKLELKDADGEITRRWAFQTTGVYKITSTLPADEGMNVPVKTGIEINFSEETDASALEGYFEIEPDVAGRFEKHRNTVVFVPTSDLKYETVYTVTVKKGVTSAGGAVLNERVTFKFKTHNTNNEYIQAKGGLAETFLPGDPAVIEVFASKGFSNQPINLTIYQYENAAAYKKALEGYISGKKWGEKYVFPTSGLKSVFTSSSEKLASTQTSRYYSANYIMLPDNLAEGYYIANISATLSGRNFHMQYLLQISPISVYAGVLPREAVFFINDTETGGAAKGADIGFDINGKTFTAITNADGAALMRLDTNGRGEGVMSVLYQDHAYYDLLDYRDSTVVNPDENYYMYLYTDREAYLTSDTVNVWGLVIPRKTSTPLPVDLNIVFGGSDTVSKPVPVTLKPDGSFTASYSYENREESWWFPIELNSGDKTLFTKSVTIQDYVKPTYVIDAEAPLYAWMPHKEPFLVSASASFFEGTPAKGVSIVFGDGYYFPSRMPESAVTDDTGYAESKILANAEDSWYPDPLFVSFQLSGMENEYQYQYKTVYALFRDVMLETDFRDGTLSLKTSMVDPKNFKPRQTDENSDYTSGGYYNLDYDSYYNDYYFYYGGYYEGYGESDSSSYADMLRGAPRDTTVKCELKRIWYTKTILGSYYNYIAKQTEYEYNYERNEETVGTYTINTRGGAGAISLPTDKPDSTYYVNLSYNDTQGQPVKQTRYLYTGAYYSWSQTYKHNFYLTSGAYTFTEGQALDFKLMDNEAEAEVGKNGRIFYTISSTGFLSRAMSDKAEFSHKMATEYIPNVYIGGAYFDGRNVYTVQQRQYRFDPVERGAKLDIKTDKQTYSPGDAASITVTATDSKGQRLPGAAVSLSVVDEAAFAIAGQNVNILKNLFSEIYLPSVANYCSYVEHQLGGDNGAEMGEGGADIVRRDFKDTAAFLTGTTNGAGTAVFAFKLPDNLTSWRVTAQAAGNSIDGELAAGNDKTALIVTLPFFLTVNSLPQYIEGDDINISARSNGAASGGAVVTGNIKGGGTNETVTAKSGETLVFGKLPKGEYALLVSASEGGNRDAIELPVEVVDTLLETAINKSFDLSEGVPDINPLRYPVHMYFYDNQYKFYTEALTALLRSYGDRADFRIARAFAHKEFGYIDESGYLSNLSDITQNGIARLLSYSGADYELTGLICAAAPEIVNKAAAVNKFYDTLNYDEHTAAEVASCYFGLAALGEPVLADILSLLENEEISGSAYRLKLAAALALLGDYDNALKYYLATAGTDGIRTNAAGTEVHFNGQAGLVTLTEDFIIHQTSLALITAAILNLPEAEGMARYLMNANSTEQTVVLELMVFLKYYRPKVEGDAVFTYDLDGKTFEVALKRFRGTRLSFGKQQLLNADFKVISGGVGVKLNYTGAITEEDAAPTLTVTKSYRSVSGGYAPGDLIEVTLAVSNYKQYNSYIFDDVIPSGARYVGEAPGSFGWVERSGQRITGRVRVNNSNSAKIKYRIRLTAQGEFVSESVVARDNEGGFGVSERDVFTIK